MNGWLVVAMIAANQVVHAFPFDEGDVRSDVSFAFQGTATATRKDIAGIVRDSVSWDPVSGVNVVLLEDTTLRSVTNDLGQFHIVGPSSSPVSRRILSHALSARENRSLKIFTSLGESIETGHSALFTYVRDNNPNRDFPLAKGSAASNTLRFSARGFSTRICLLSTDTTTHLQLGLLPDTSAQINSLNTLLSDMTLPGEALPHGIVGDWTAKPRLGAGVTPPNYMTAFMAWGQIYEASTGNPGANYRVNLRDMRTYALYKSDGKWHLIQASKGMQGSAYVENFAGDVHKPAGEKIEADGSISVRVGGGYNFHFWNSTGRTTLQPTNVSGLYTTFQARLIPDNPAKPDDRAACKIIGSMGGDWWRDLNAQWAADWSNNLDYAIGRFKFIGKPWQSYSAWAGDSAAFRSNPPPLD